MIVDYIKNAAYYKGMMPGIATALEKVAQYTPETCTSGRIDIDGDNLFLKLSTLETHSSEGANCEAHQKYLDLFYIVEGEEVVYVKPTEVLTNITHPYDAEKDRLLAKLDADAEPVRLTTGMFIILYPHEAHAPCCYDKVPGTVKKVVAKIKL